MTQPLALLGVDVGDLVEDLVRALVDLIIPDLGADWVSRVVTWLVALPPVTSSAFPSLNAYAHQLTAVGFGLLGATVIAALLQLWAGTSAPGAGLVLRRAVLAAGALAAYPTVIEALLVGTNILTAQMIRHPLVVDGLDKAFGEALAVAAVTGGVSLGLAVGAALAVLYFLAALFIMKIGLTALLAVLLVSGALVWGIYPLPQAQWAARAWTSGLAAVLAVPIAWACVFAVAALLSRDTLIFESDSQFNEPLGGALSHLVKPFAAVACFWLAYRAPFFMLTAARSLGISGAVLGSGTTASSAEERGGLHGAVARGARTNAERFAALRHGAHAALSRAGHRVPRTPVRGPATRLNRPAPKPGGGTPSRVPEPATRRAAALMRVPARLNTWWRSLPYQERSGRAAQGLRPSWSRSQGRDGRRSTSTQPSPSARPEPQAAQPPQRRNATRKPRSTPARAGGGGRVARRPGTPPRSSEPGGGPPGAASIPGAPRTPRTSQPTRRSAAPPSARQAVPPAPTPASSRAGRRPASGPQPPATTRCDAPTASRPAPSVNRPVVSRAPEPTPRQAPNTPRPASAATAPSTRVPEPPRAAPTPRPAGPENAPRRSDRAVQPQAPRPDSDPRRRPS